MLARRRNFGVDLAAFQKLMNSIKRGDIVGISGFPGKSKRGELSIFPKDMQVRRGGWGVGGVGGGWQDTQRYKVPV